MRQLALILIVMSCVFQAALPTSAAEYTLDIFGNANMDDTIDENDITYVEGIIGGSNEDTQLADANYDGVVDEDDISQIELIIRGEETELTVIDALENIVTVKKPLERVIVFVTGQFETLRSIKASDTIVGMPQDSLWDPVFFPEMSELANLGYKWDADIEAILNLHPDAAILHADSRQLPVREALEKTDPSITLLTFSCTTHNLEPTDYSPYSYLKEVKMLGYIFDKREEADEFCSWYEDVMNPIKERVAAIPEEDKPTVYYEYNKYSIRDYNDRVAFAGGKNIFEEGRTIDPEAVVDLDPDIIVNLAMGVKGGYDKGADDISELRDVWGDFMDPDDPEYRPELANVSAVRNNRVYVLANVFSIASRGGNGAKGFMEVLYMAKWFHPELFEDLDPKAIHQEYITRFQGLDIDLDEKGVFAYPEPS